MSGESDSLEEEANKADLIRGVESAMMHVMAEFMKKQRNK